MNVPVISHVNADSDLIEAWVRHYMALGASSFHLIVHGSWEVNSGLWRILNRYPLHIEEQYEGEFDSREKKRRIDGLLARMVGRWVLMVDSDEFLELPYSSLATTVRALGLARADVFYAPMLQHLNSDGGLQTPNPMREPFREQPVCSEYLYRLMGSRAAINKYPLFLCRESTVLSDGGNHNPPVGCQAATARLRGVLHHFKFRQAVLDRLQCRIESNHPFRDQSVEFLQYLQQNDFRLPLEGSFPYSRRELFRRGLLIRPGPSSLIRSLLRRLRRGR